LSPAEAGKNQESDCNSASALASACREEFLERGTGFEPATITLEE
jgi:hypothetical protein